MPRRPVHIRDRDSIHAHLSQDPYRHLLELGDLPDDQWRHTTWYGYRDGDSVQALVLLYTRFTRPILLALGQREPDLMRNLLEALLPSLPEQLHAHLTLGLEAVLAARYRITWSAHFHKLALLDREKLTAADTSRAVRLTPADVDDALALYAEALPESAFYPAALGRLPYFGVRADGRLVSLAGTHVYAPQYGVAAIGNVATHPDHRNRGYAQAAVAALCQEIAREAPHIGLNVRADNAPALACYDRIGFRPASTYAEHLAEAR